jgi:hypothetical protein
VSRAELVERVSRAPSAGGPARPGPGGPPRRRGAARRAALTSRQPWPRTITASTSSSPAALKTASCTLWGATPPSATSSGSLGIGSPSMAAPTGCLCGRAERCAAPWPWVASPWACPTIAARLSSTGASSSLKPDDPLTRWLTGALGPDEALARGDGDRRRAGRRVHDLRRGQGPGALCAHQHPGAARGHRPRRRRVAGHPCPTSP